MNNAALPRFFNSFTAGSEGGWRIDRIDAVCGASLPPARCLDIRPSTPAAASPQAQWVLRGATSNERYVTRAEKTALNEKPAPLGRSGASRAVLIPIRKSPLWWSLPQDERRAIIEEKSRHITIGLTYMPAIARRLYHCRDIDGQEPFDFLTWFEFAPADEMAFDELLRLLRATEEWRYVDREVEVRLSLATEPSAA
jgi:hypothetical protein